MIRRTMVAMAITLLALIVPATVAAATDDASSLGAPQSAGLLPAAEAPAAPASSPVAPLLQLAGLVLLVAGTIVVGSSWVSPAEAV